MQCKKDDKCMVKDFNTYINEDYFSKLANRKDTGSVRKENDITEDDVLEIIDKSFINQVHSILLKKENGNTVVHINGNVALREDIEEIPFQFGKITGNFSCENCINLTSLRGCPREVTGYFDCSYCEELMSLEGCPNEVGGEFYCHDCGRDFNTIEVRTRCHVLGDIVV